MADIDFKLKVGDIIYKTGTFQKGSWTTSIKDAWPQGYYKITRVGPSVYSSHQKDADYAYSYGYVKCTMNGAKVFKNTENGWCVGAVHQALDSKVLEVVTPAP